VKNKRIISRRERQLKRKNDASRARSSPILRRDAPAEGLRRKKESGKMLMGKTKKKDRHLKKGTA